MFKHTLISFYLLLSISLSYGQNQLKDTDTGLFRLLIKEFQKRDTIKNGFIYDPKTHQWYRSSSAVSSPAFDSIFKPIFGKVMLGNSDLVNQGSAYALSVNQFESKFSINYNWMANKKQLNGKYYNIGFSASSTSKLLPVFSKDEWQQGFTLSAGITRPFKKVLSYNKGEDFVIKRKRAMILSLKEIYESLLFDTTQFKSAVAGVDSTSFAILYGKISGVQLKSNKNLADEQVKEDRLNYLRSLNADGKKVTDFVDSCVAAFELKYLKDMHYRFWWYNVLVRPEYKGVNVYDTTGARIVGVKKKDYFRIGIEAYANFVKSASKYLFMLQMGSGFKNSNYLEGRKPTDLEFLQNVEDNVTILENTKGVIVEGYERYKKQFLLIQPVVGFNWFFGENRRFGWETFTSAKIGIKSKDIPFDNLFTVRSGLLVSLNGKSDLAKSTFGLLVQWEDLKFKSASIDDNFTFSVRIGIPFNY